MLQYLRLIWNICVLRSGPQDMPFSWVLLLLLIIAGIALDSYGTVILFPQIAGKEIISSVTIYNLSMLMVVYVLLYLLRYANRGIQTLTALAGSGLFISLVLLPALLVINQAPQTPKPFGIIILIDNIWRLLVNAHIFRHALSIGILMSMIIAVSYFLLGILVVEFLLSPEGG